MGIWASVSKVRPDYGDECFQIFSYRQMKRVYLTKPEAISVAIQLLAQSGITDTSKLELDAGKEWPVVSKD